MRISVCHPGRVTCGDTVFQCALGRGGIGGKTKEGDGITPTGIFALRAIYFRPDRMPAPKTELPVIPLTSTDGWCDDADHPNYNCLIKTPFKGSHEKMWREDDLYNLVIPLGFNDDPVVVGKGSAIFIHIARPDFKATEGCVALQAYDLLDLLRKCNTNSEVEIVQP